MEGNSFLRDLMYAMQGYDSVNSVKTFQRGGYETNPSLRPFSHGGVPTMAGGMALQDFINDLVLKQGHASQGQTNTAEIMGILASLFNIIQTNQNREGGHSHLGALPNAAQSGATLFPLLRLKF